MDLRKYEDMFSAYIEQLGGIGAGPEGVFRASYTDAYEEAVDQVAKWMTDHSLCVRKDSAGNLIGRIDGTGNNKSVIAMGSHLDTVRGGGLYDGALGVLGGVIAAGYLLKKYGRPKRPVEVIAFTGEEGSRFSGLLGSKWMAGFLGDQELRGKDANGVSAKEAAGKKGYDLGNEHDIPRKDIEAFIELHIEQGPVLEEKGIPIGVVSGITGIRQAEIRILGRKDHAGTTPMNMRKDALIASVGLIRDMDSHVRRAGGNAVFTVGKIETRPGSINVVAEECTFTIDLRDPDSEKINRLNNDLERMARETASRADLQVDWHEILTVEPVPCCPLLKEVLGEAARSLGLKFLEIPSGAGHDALMIAKIAPIGMIFVPSRQGRSHCPEEYSSSCQCVAGIAVLAESIRRLAYE